MTETLNACSRRTGNRNSRDSGQTVLPKHGKRRMRGVHELRIQLARNSTQ